MRSPELQAERPIAFEVIINLKTAYSSPLPPTLRATADEVSE
jgi:hypothetical protein